MIFLKIGRLKEKLGNLLNHIKTNIVNKTGKFIGSIEISTRVLSNNYKITVTVEES
jgi:hypothetical protein